MDKSKIIADRTFSFKKGFALLFTLSVLVVIIGLTGVLMSYFSKVKQDSTHTKALMQANIYYADIKKMLSSQKNRKSIYGRLYKTSESFTSPDKRFSLMIKCNSLSNGININWLGQHNNQKMKLHYNTAINIFESIVQLYSLEDGARLQEMLLKEIGGKKRFVKMEESRLQQKKGILTYNQFERIVKRYQFEVDDAKASRVPWKKFFVFNLLATDMKANVVDAEYSSPELISLLFDIDMQIVREWYGSLEKGSVKSFVNENNPYIYKAMTKILAKGFLKSSICTVSYAYADGRYKFNFEDIDSEVKNFEFYGKQ